MRRILAGGLLLAALGCYEPLPPSQVVWENPVASADGLRDEVREVVVFDAAQSFDRNGSLVVQTLGDSSFLLFAIEADRLAGTQLENRQISLQGRLRTEGLEGGARLELGVRIAGGDTFRAVPDMPSLSGDTDWVMQEANFFTARGERPDGLFVMLGVEGAGKVWIDHLKLLSTARSAP